MEAFADIIFAFRGSSEWFAHRIWKGYFVRRPSYNPLQAGPTSSDYISLRSTYTGTLLSPDQSTQTHDPVPARSK